MLWAGEAYRYASKANRMFDYAENTSQWEKWQLEYRFGAFYIFPPEPIITSVDGLRSTHDPKSNRYCRAHISLSEPLGAPLTAAQLDEIREVLAAVASFTLTYGPVKNSPPWPGVSYTISPEARFNHLRSILHTTSAFAKVPRKREHIAPHMTIAEFITLERTEELLNELSGRVPEGEFLCDSIDYAVPNADFYFERRVAVSLGAA